jgi:hypothetical protein
VDDAVVAKLAEDVVEERERDALRGRDRFALQRVVGRGVRGDLDRCPHGVVSFRRDSHTPNAIAAPNPGERPTVVAIEGAPGRSV